MPSKSMFTLKIGRDSKNGEFVKVSEAKRRPSTTEVEHIKIPRKKNSR